MKPKTALLTGLILIMLATAGMYVTGDNTSTEAEAIDTSNWVTYRNEELGFEVKHPEGWRIYVPTKTRTDLDRVLFGPSDMSEDDMWWGITRYSLVHENYDFETFVANIERRHKLVVNNNGVYVGLISSEEQFGYPAVITYVNSDEPDSIGSVGQETLHIHRDNFVWSWVMGREFVEGMPEEQYLNVTEYEGIIKTFRFID